MCIKMTKRFVVDIIKVSFCPNWPTQGLCSGQVRSDASKGGEPLFCLIENHDPPNPYTDLHPSLEHSLIFLSEVKRGQIGTTGKAISLSKTCTGCDALVSRWVPLLLAGKLWGSMGWS